MELEAWEAAFSKALEEDDLPKAIGLLEQRSKSSGTPLGSDKWKALKIIQALTSGPDDLCRWTIRLMDYGSPTARDLGAMLTVEFIGPFYQQHPDKVQEFMIRIADDPHWEIRETAAHLFKAALINHFAQIYPLLQEWTKHSSENVRRAVAVGVKYVGKEGKPEWGEPLFDLLEPLFSDRSAYVRKNLGPFAIGDGFLRYYPELTIKRLIRYAAAEDAQVRWNVAMAFSTAEAARHVDEALPILERLASDDRRFVWYAVGKAMRNLGRRAPEKVMPVLEAWLEDEKRVRPAEAALKYLQ
jgi:3-methyladenine DNA glycosylase AlkD